MKTSVSVCNLVEVAATDNAPPVTLVDEAERKTSGSTNTIDRKQEKQGICFLDYQLLRLIKLPNIYSR